MTRHLHAQCGIVVLWAVAFLPAAPVLAQQPPSPSIEKVAGEEAAPVAADPGLLKSLFFSEAESEAIAQARRQFSSHGTHEDSEADLLDQLQGIMASKKPEEELQDKHYAQFYLESLMYHAPGDWTAWLKSGDTSKKFTQEMITAGDIDLTVVAVDKENITFEWKPKDWVWISNTFKEGKDPIQLDQSSRSVIFTLRTNQTLIAYDMKLVEGFAKLLPVDAEGRPVGEKNLPGDPGAASGNAAADGSKPLTAGILKQYKKIEPTEKTP